MKSRQIRWRKTIHHGDSGSQAVEIYLKRWGAKGLYSIFVNYGVVMDVFIPNKRRKLTRSRFGFVRYNCSIAAAVAV
ncbi:hypothetical protein ACSBR1_033830 [Camellia fascicularis]